MQVFSYQPVSRAWGSKFLASYAAAPLASRNAVSLATRFAVQSLQVQNRSGSTATVGWGGRLPADSTLWKAGQWVNATTTFGDDTTDAQDVGTGDFALTTTTNNDGFIVFSQIPINILSLIVSQATTGSPAYEVSYTVAGGSWSTITLANLLVAPAFAATGEQLLWWANPGDLAVSVADHGTGVPIGYYGYRVRATTAPSQAALASQIIPGVIADSVKSVGLDGVVSWDYAPGEHPVAPQCDALAIAISVASDQNHVSVSYRLRG